MEIQGRHRIVALLAVLTYLSAATSGTAFGQSANMVNLRTTVPAAWPGRVAAHVTVSRSRVRVGEWVMVNLAPPAGVNRPLFRVSFGDGREEVTRSRQIDHKYAKVGHYDVYAWVESETPPIVRPVPRVLLSVAPNPAKVEQPVTFKAQLADNYPGIKYRFVFGDNDQTGWQTQPQTTHPYARANTYQAYVDIGLEDNGSTKQLGSAREAILVNAQQRDSVDLTADPTTVEVGRRVVFNARARSRDPNISYRFVFGDGSPSNWQTNSQATHEYASPNTYLAYVQIRSSSLTFSSPIISSARKPIRVIARTPPRVSVELTVAPTTVKTETPVTFTARVDPRDGNTRYRFFYGDGASSDWQVSPTSGHEYSVANTYFAYVETGLSNSNQRITPGATSKTKQVTVTSSPTPPTPTPTPTPASSPTPSPVGSPSPSPGSSPSPSPGSSPTSSPGSSPGSSPSGSPSLSPGISPVLSPGSSPILPPGGSTDPFPWWYLLIALLIGGGYWTFKALFLPRPTFSSRTDAGSSKVDEGSKALAIESQILLKPNIADGQSRIGVQEGNLIQSVRREND